MIPDSQRIRSGWINSDLSLNFLHLVIEFRCYKIDKREISFGNLNTQLQFNKKCK